VTLDERVNDSGDLCEIFRPQCGFRPEYQDTLLAQQFVLDHRLSLPQISSVLPMGTAMECLARRDPPAGSAAEIRFAQSLIILKWN
jgi:hypothetical protein